jgi:hypothetical protein
MPYPLVATATIQFIADPPMQFGTIITPIPTYPVPPFPLVVSSTKLKALTLEVALDSDMQSQVAMIGTIPYWQTSYTGGTLTWDGKLLGSTIASKLKKIGSGVVLDSAGGTVEFSIVIAAVDPSTSSTDPNAINPPPQYTGTWEIVSNPNTKLQVSS